MDFFKNLSIRIKIFSGVLVTVLVFLVLIFSQFNYLGKTKGDVIILDNIQKAENAVQDLAMINNTEVRVMLEIISNEDQVEIKKMLDEHKSRLKRVPILYDSLFVYLRRLYPKNKSAGRMRVLNFVNGSNSKFNNVLKAYFENAYRIKQKQLVEGNEFNFVNQIITSDDSTDVLEGIIPIKESDIQGSTRSVQMFKIFYYYKKNSKEVGVQYEEILQELSNYFDKYKSKIIANNQGIISRNGVFFVILLIAITVVLYFTGNTISTPLKKLEEQTLRLAEGELPDHPEKVTTSDEIGNMARALNTLTDGLIKTSEFAIEIGRSNFTSKFEPLSEKDVLGNALLDMRTSLQSANKEENKRKIEDKERNWTTEGLARFGDILRKHTENINLLSRDIIQNLVKYLNANQGGIFILNDTDPQDVFLELISSYAYSREKFIKKRIKLGEGLLGGVAIEKYTVYMTDLPEEYIDIESGLGGSNPKSLLIVPLKLEEEILGVIELASFNEMKKYEIELVERIAESIASTLSTTKVNTTTAELLEKARVREQEMKERDELLKRNIGKLKIAQKESDKRKAELKKEVEELESIRVSMVGQTKLQTKKIEQITREINKAQADNEQLLNAVMKGFDISFEPIILVNQYIRISIFNKTAEDITGFGRAELIGKGLDSIFEHDFAEKIDNNISMFFQTNRKVLLDDEIELTMKTKLDEKVPILLKMEEIILDNQNNVILLIKNLDAVVKLKNERDKIKEELMLKEFNYTIRINNLDYFIKEKNLELPHDIEARNELIRWNDAFSIGLKTIDNQHKKWIDFINTLYREYKLKSGKERVLEDIAKLLDYADYHFGFKEKYMEDFNFEGINKHKKIHADLIEKVKQLRDRFANNENEAVYRLIVLLNNWTLEHIQTYDIEYVDCFKRNGLT